MTVTWYGCWSCKSLFGTMRVRRRSGNLCPRCGHPDGVRYLSPAAQELVQSSYALGGDQAVRALWGSVFVDPGATVPYWEVPP